MFSFPIFYNIEITEQYQKKVGILLKRIFILFLILIGLYFLMTLNVRSLLPFTKGQTEVTLTNHIDIVEINVSSVKATIIPDNGNDVKVDLDGKGEVNVKKNGDRINVEYSRKWFDGFNFFNKTPKLKIYIPEDFNRNLGVNVGSGTLKFDGSSMKLEELKVAVSSGKVDIENITADDFIHKGSSGMIDIDTIVAKQGKVDMSSGVVKIRDYQGALDARVSSGQLNVQMDKLVDDINLRASSGQIKLDLPDHADLTLNGKASSGYIDCDLPLMNKISEKNRLEGVLGAGTHDVDVQVSSGMVKIY